MKNWELIHGQRIGRAIRSYRKNYYILTQEIDAWVLYHADLFIERTYAKNDQNLLNAFKWADRKIKRIEKETNQKLAAIIFG